MKKHSFIWKFFSHMTLLLGWLWGLYILKIKNRVKVIGKKNLLHTTGILYVPNHQTLIDAFLIGASILSFKEALFYPSRIPWYAADKVNFLSHKVGKILFSLLRCVPVVRGRVNKEVIEEQINFFKGVLDFSNLLIFFEGTRTRDGSIGRCKAGVAQTILEAQPKYVVPILLDGIQAIMPVEAGFNYFGIQGGHRGTIVIGKPIELSDLLSNGANAKWRKEIGKRIYDATIALKDEVKNQEKPS